MREPEKIKGVRPPYLPQSILQLKAAKSNAPALLGVQLQSVLRKSPLDSRLYSLGVIFILYQADEIIGIANQFTKSPRLLLDDPFKPVIEHIVQKHVRKQRADNAA